MIKYRISLVIAITLLLISSSCSLTKSKEIAESAVVQFHNQYNAGQFREIYVQADKEFKSSTTEADFIVFLEALRRKIGTFNKAQQATWNVNVRPMGTMVTLIYNVDFTEGKGTEQFIFRVSGEKAMLYSYNVNSPLLITK
jgi:hypothetical protein